MDDDQEQGEPLTLEEMHTRMNALKQMYLTIGGYAKANQALENIETLTDKQLDFWMVRSTLHGRLEFFDALGDRPPTKKMKKWISKPELTNDFVNFHVIYGKQNVARFIKAVIAHGADTAVGPHLVDLACKYELEDILFILEADSRV